MTVAAPPVTTRVSWGYDAGYGYDGEGYGYGTPGVMYRHDRREDFERMRRQQREEMRRHAEWLRDHGGGVSRGGRR